MDLSCAYMFGDRSIEAYKEHAKDGYFAAAESLKRHISHLRIHRFGTLSAGEIEYVVNRLRTLVKSLGSIVSLEMQERIEDEVHNSLAQFGDLMNTPENRERLSQAIISNLSVFPDFSAEMFTRSSTELNLVVSPRIWVEEINMNINLSNGSSIRSPARYVDPIRGRRSEGITWS